MLHVRYEELLQSKQESLIVVAKKNTQQQQTNTKQQTKQNTHNLTLIQSTCEYAFVRDVGTRRSKTLKVL